MCLLLRLVSGATRVVLLLLVALGQLLQVPEHRRSPAVGEGLLVGCGCEERAQGLHFAQ